MTDERERGGEGSEGGDDLFEDLDTFFKPIEDLDADEPAPLLRPPTPNPAGSDPPAPVSPPSDPEGPASVWSPDEEDAEGDDEEFLPSGWSAGLVTAGADAGAPAGPSPSDEPPVLDMGSLFEAGEGVQPPLRTEPASPADESVKPPFSLGEDLEDRQEEGLAGQEWDRFRSALDSVDLGDEPTVSPSQEPEPPAFGAPAETGPTPDGDDAFVEATSRDDVIEPGRGAASGPPRSTDEEQEESGITLEDLRAMPPVYRDLPGPEDGSEEPPLFVAPSGGTAEIAAADDDAFAEGPDATEAVAPSGEALEAAADHFAESMRRSPEEVEEDLLSDLDRADDEPVTVRVGPAESSVAYPDEPPEGAPRRRAVRVGAADPLAHGPSWQDSSSEEVEGGAGAPIVAARNIPQALLVAAVLAAAAILTLWVGPAPFGYFAGLVVLAAQGECYAATMRGRRYHPATALGLVFGALVLFAAYLRGEAAMGAMVVLALVFTMLWYMATPARARRNTLASVAITVFGVLYVPYLAGHALLILSAPAEGRALLIAILALVFVNDAAAYVGGSTMRGWVTDKPLAPTVSPRKTWEGLIIGAVATAAIGAIALPAILDTFDGRPLLGLGIALVVAVAGTFGDLAESLLKRDLRIKDMGTLFPGHGGALDRIDSVLFAAPAAYFFLRLFL